MSYHQHRPTDNGHDTGYAYQHERERAHEQVHDHGIQHGAPLSQGAPALSSLPSLTSISHDDAVFVQPSHPFRPPSAISGQEFNDVLQPTAGPSSQQQQHQQHQQHQQQYPHRSSSFSEASAHFASSEVADVLSSFRVRDPGQDGSASCDRCRRRKIKCDKAKPVCGTCTRLAVNCRYSDVLHKRGPPTKRERAVLASMGVTFTPERKRLEEARSERIDRIPPAPRTDAGVIRPSRPPAANRHPYHSRPRPPSGPPLATMLPPAPPTRPPPPAFDPNAQTQSTEVPGSASSVRDLLEKTNALMPIGGGSDQATAAVLQTRFSSILGFEDPGHGGGSVGQGSGDDDDDKPSQVYAVGGDGCVRLKPLHSYPKRVAEVFAQQSSMLDFAYLQSIGIDPSDAASLRRGILRLVADPAAVHMHDYILYFGNRAPTVNEAFVRNTFERVRAGQGASDSLSLERLAHVVTVAFLAGSDCLPLPLDGGRAYAAIPEFATACYKVAAAIAIPRYGALLSPPDPLEALQLHSWLCTASAYTDKPLEGMLFWSRSAWGIVKAHGLHHVRTDPRKRTGPCTGAEFRAEMTVRAIWGLVVVSNFSALLAPGIPVPVTEDIGCSYPRSIYPPEWTVDQIPDRHFSPEIFDAWTEYIRIHHVLQRITISILARGIWNDVEDRARGFFSAGAGLPLSPDPYAAPEPYRSSVWIEATRIAVEKWYSLIEGFTRDLMLIASDCHAFKAHAAQPKLNTGQTDMHGWLYVVQHALQLYAVCQERLSSAAADVDQARFSLTAMSCPLPPSMASQSRAGDSDDVADAASSVHGYPAPAESVLTFESGDTPRSPGAQSVPLQSAPGGPARGHRYQYGYGGEYGAGQEHVAARADMPPPLAAAQSREKLNSNIADWISQVPRSEIPAFVVGDLTQMG